MSIRKYIQDSHEKKELVKEFVNLINIDENTREKSLDRLNIQDINEVYDLFINLGNISYFTGDYDTFKYFIESLFNVLNIELRSEKDTEFLNNIHNYGQMSVYNHNITPFQIIANNIKYKIFDLKGVDIINQYLHILRDLALKAEKNNFEMGFLKILYVFREVSEYFLKENLNINNFYLKNTIISLISSAKKNRKISIKNKIINEMSETFNNAGNSPQTNFYDSKLENSREVGANLKLV